MAMIPFNAFSSRSSRSSRLGSRADAESYYGEPTTYTPRRSSTASSVYSSASTAKTFGDSSREGYTPCQAPADYYYSRKAQVEWNTAPRTPDGTRIRSGRYSYEGGYSSSRSGRGSSGSSRQGDSAVDRYIESPASSLESSPERYQGSGYEGTVVPEDSISQVSSYRSGDSRKPRRAETDEFGTYETGYYEGSKAGRSSGRSARSERPIAYGYSVVEVKPTWA